VTGVQTCALPILEPFRCRSACTHRETAIRGVSLGDDRISPRHVSALRCHTSHATPGEGRWPAVGRRQGIQYLPHATVRRHARANGQQNCRTSQADELPMTTSSNFPTERDEHPFAPYVRILGKGKRGSRSLTETEAFEAMSMILDGQVLDLQLGAFLMLLRVKEESPEEIAGFVRACRERLAPPTDLVADL